MYKILRLFFELLCFRLKFFSFITIVKYLHNFFVHCMKILFFFKHDFFTSFTPKIKKLLFGQSENLENENRSPLSDVQTHNPIAKEVSFFLDLKNQERLSYRQALMLLLLRRRQFYRSKILIRYIKKKNFDILYEIDSKNLESKFDKDFYFPKIALKDAFKEKIKVLYNSKTFIFYIIRAFNSILYFFKSNLTFMKKHNFLRFKILNLQLKKKFDDDLEFIENLFKYYTKRKNTIFFDDIFKKKFIEKNKDSFLSSKLGKAKLESKYNSLNSLFFFNKYTYIYNLYKRSSYRKVILKNMINDFLIFNYSFKYDKFKKELSIFLSKILKNFFIYFFNIFNLIFRFINFFFLFFEILFIYFYKIYSIFLPFFCLLFFFFFNLVYIFFIGKLYFYIRKFLLFCFHIAFLFLAKPFLYPKILYKNYFYLIFNKNLLLVYWKDQIHEHYNLQENLLKFSFLNMKIDLNVSDILWFLHLEKINEEINKHDKLRRKNIFDYIFTNEKKKSKINFMMFLNAQNSPMNIKKMLESLGSHNLKETEYDNYIKLLEKESKLNFDKITWIHNMKKRIFDVFFLRQILDTYGDFRRKKKLKEYKYYFGLRLKYFFKFIESHLENSILGNYILFFLEKMNFIYYVYIYENLDKQNFGAKFFYLNFINSFFFIVIYLILKLISFSKIFFFFDSFIKKFVYEFFRFFFNLFLKNNIYKRNLSFINILLILNTTRKDLRLRHNFLLKSKKFQYFSYKNLKNKKNGNRNVNIFSRNINKFSNFDFSNKIKEEFSYKYSIYNLKRLYNKYYKETLKNKYSFVSLTDLNKYLLGLYKSEKTYKELQEELDLKRNILLLLSRNNSKKLVLQWLKHLNYMLYSSDKNFLLKSLDERFIKYEYLYLKKLFLILSKKHRINFFKDNINKKKRSQKLFFYKRLKKIRYLRGALNFLKEKPTFNLLNFFNQSEINLEIKKRRAMKHKYNLRSTFWKEDSQDYTFFHKYFISKRDRYWFRDYESKKMSGGRTDEDQIFWEENFNINQHLGTKFANLDFSSLNLRLNVPHMEYLKFDFLNSLLLIRFRLFFLFRMYIYLFYFLLFIVLFFFEMLFLSEFFLFLDNYFDIFFYLILLFVFNFTLVFLLLPFYLFFSIPVFSYYYRVISFQLKLSIYKPYKFSFYNLLFNGTIFYLLKSLLFKNNFFDFLSHNSILGEYKRTKINYVNLKFTNFFFEFFYLILNVLLLFIIYIFITTYILNINSIFISFIISVLFYIQLRRFLLMLSLNNANKSIFWKIFVFKFSKYFFNQIFFDNTFIDVLFPIIKKTPFKLNQMSEIFRIIRNVKIILLLKKLKLFKKLSLKKF